MRIPVPPTVLSWACALIATTGCAQGAQPHVAGTPAGATQVLPGVVVGIVDGDTADVRLESGMIRIRLHGIDAPEIGQPYGNTARTCLSDLVYGKNVLVEPYEQDRYDRLVARIWFGERDINAEMIKSGFAWVYRRYAEDPRYCAYEKGARDRRQGLWQSPSQEAIAPWEWRKRRTLGGQFTDYDRESVATCLGTLGK